MLSLAIILYLSSVCDVVNNPEGSFLFSVIIPIYNTARYLEQALDSLINQSIGFQGNVQIILVNDGSTDRSEAVCLKYTKQYPKNIMYISQQNLGVSAARNAGIPYVRGKYVNFLDSDDYWSPKTFELVADFFRHHETEVDFITCRSVFFEANTDFTDLDYVFNTTGVKDLTVHYGIVQMDVTNAFVKSESLEKVTFNTHLEYAEDAMFANSILLNKCKIGIIREALHYHRRRADGSSAIQCKHRPLSFFFDTLVYFHSDLFMLSKQMYGRVLDFIYFCSMYDLKWRVLSPTARERLSEADLGRYSEMIVDRLSLIPDNIILLQDRLSLSHKMLCLSKKYRTNVVQTLTYHHGWLYYRDYKLINIVQNPYILQWQSIRIKEDTIYLEGKVALWFTESMTIYAHLHQDHIKHTSLDRMAYSDNTLFGEIPQKGRVVFIIKLRRAADIAIRFSLETSYFTETIESLPPMSNSAKSYSFYSGLQPLEPCGHTKNKDCYIQNNRTVLLIKRKQTPSSLPICSLMILFALLFRQMTRFNRSNRKNVGC